MSSKRTAPGGNRCTSIWIRTKACAAKNKQGNQRENVAEDDVRLGIAIIAS